MKKRMLLLCTLCIFCFIGSILMICLNKTQLTLRIDDNSQLSLVLGTHGAENILYPYQNPTDGITYFFLPSYAADNTITVQNLSRNDILFNGEYASSNFTFRRHHEGHFELSILPLPHVHPKQHTYQIVFMQSSNIPAIFIETESGSMAYLNEDKSNSESGQICILDTDGNTTYSDHIEHISGRGNSTWFYDKKPYTITLQNASPLLGMDQGKKWNLLPVVRESNHMSTKISLDIASALGLAFTSKCTWIDLYLNGEYNGNYLLCEAVSVENGRVEIHNLEKENQSKYDNLENAPVFANAFYKGYDLTNVTNTNGGYLIEKEHTQRFDEEACGFITNSNAYFVLKSPEHASQEQVKYIYDYFQTIEDMILNGVPDYENYIDLPSFAARFLVDEITLNFDANITSMFFYKDKSNNLLYAGPVWDYDGSMGYVDGWNDYERSSLDNPRMFSLNWYHSLYMNPQFYDQVVTDFTNPLPYMETLLDSKIDEYADMIRASVSMDEVRWQNMYSAIPNANMLYPNRSPYLNFDNRIRYLKYFLSNRLNFLCQKWNISYKQFTAPCTDELHEVVFFYHDSVIEKRLVPDGNTVADFPNVVNTETRWIFSSNGQIYNDKLPIYEDCTLYALE